MSTHYKDPMLNTKSKWITLAPIEYGVLCKQTHVK